jgi:hypothetical protein
MLAGFIALSFSAFAQIDSVYYHNYVFNSQWGASGAQPSEDFYKYATRFTPPYYPAQLVGVRAWFRNCNSNSSFNWYVYTDSTGAALGPPANPVYHTTVGYPDPAIGGMQDTAYSAYIDVTSQTIIVDTGDIYAGVSEHLMNNPFVGMAFSDSNHYTTNRCWVYDGGWTEMVNWVFVNGEWGITTYFMPITTGISDVRKNDISANIYPNPSNGNYEMSYNLPSGNGIFSINDIMGRQVYSTAITATNGLKAINTSFLDNGIFYWKLTDEYGTSKSGRITILK